MSEPEEEKSPKQQSSDAKSKPVEREIRPKEVVLQELSKFSESRATKAGEEGIFLLPMGSNDTNPFTSPQASQNPTQTEKPSSGTSTPNASIPSTPVASKDTSD